MNFPTSYNFNYLIKSKQRLNINEKEITFLYIIKKYKREFGVIRYNPTNNDSATMALNSLEYKKTKNREIKIKSYKGSLQLMSSMFPIYNIMLSCIYLA